MTTRRHHHHHLAAPDWRAWSWLIAGILAGLLIVLVLAP